MDSNTLEFQAGLPITLNAQEWDYLSEGNQHMIFKYNGTIPNFIGTVIRVRKVMDALSVKLEKREAKMESYLQEHYLKELVNEYCFKPHPIIGPMTKINLLDVKNKGEFLEELLKRTESTRPEFRRKKTVNPNTNFELIFDYTFSLEKFSTHTHRYASLALEIKPKSAKHDEISFEEFLKIHNKTVSQLIEDQNKAISTSPEDLEKMYRKYFSTEGYKALCESGHEDRILFTRFFKTQLKKKQDKKVEEFTRFDPHDFFQKDAVNIKRALRHLLDTPQNNLKVFADGNEVDPKEQKKALNELLGHFLQLTHAEGKESEAPKGEDDLIDELGGIVAELLKETAMIEAVERFQDVYLGSSLDMVRILQYLENHIPSDQDVHPKDQLKEIVQRIKDSYPNQEELSKNGETDMNSLIEIVVRFLISIAFRDCSIFISLQFLPHEEKEDLQFAKVLEEKGFKTHNGRNNSKYKIMYTGGIIDFHMKGIQNAYSHPKSTKKLFGLLVQHIYENGLHNKMEA